MSGNSSKGSPAVAAVFTLVAAAALVAGWSRVGSGDWSGRERELLKTRQAMMTEARLHQPLQPPDYPGNTSFCGECHSLPPHPGNVVAQVFLNHHARSFECLVCHWTSSEGESPDLVWGGALPGPQGEEGKRKRLFLRLADPAEGQKRDLSSMRGRITPGQVCFDRGQGCKKCHRKGGMARFARPGASVQAAASLERLPHFLTLSRGERWYFPQRQ